MKNSFASFASFDACLGKPVHGNFLRFDVSECVEVRALFLDVEKVMNGKPLAAVGFSTRPAHVPKGWLRAYLATDEVPTWDEGFKKRRFHVDSHVIRPHGSTQDCYWWALYVEPERPCVYITFAPDEETEDLELV